MHHPLADGADHKTEQQNRGNVHGVHPAILSKSDPFPLDWDGLIAIVTPSFGDVFAASVEATADDLSVSPFDAFNERAHEYASKRGAELVGRKYDADGNLIDNPNSRWAITDTTWDDLRNLETQAFEKGWSPTELKARVNDLIDDPARAKMIADTELADAQMQGALSEAKESGVVGGKGWLLGNEHSDPDECDDNADAGVIGIDELFPSGDDAPTVHPGCDCDLYFEVTGAEE